MEDAPGDAAAEAFEALKSEVTVLRAGIETLSAALQAQPAPDYTPTLGAIAKSLEVMEAHPALRISPEALAHQMREANNLAGQQGRRQLEDALLRVASAGSNLEQLVRGWRTAREQTRQVAIVAAMGLVAGALAWMCLSGPVARMLPASWHVPERMAAATLRLDRWEAGMRLMQSANPKGWEGLVEASELSRQNKGILHACHAAAQRRGRSQRCTVMVLPKDSPQR